MASLPLAAQPADNLLTVYQGWMDRLEALAAAQLSGAYRLASNPDGAAQRRALLAEYVELEQRLAALQAQATKEKQLARRVEMNMDIHNLQEKLTKLKTTI